MSLVLHIIKKIRIKQATDGYTLGGRNFVTSWMGYDRVGDVWDWQRSSCRN